MPRRTSRTGSVQRVHIDVDWLREAYKRTRKDGAAGIDGQTAAGYATHLEDNLRSLLERAKSGTYRAPPVLRTYIPKDSGEMRPLGIPTMAGHLCGYLVSTPRTRSDGLRRPTLS